MENKTNWIRLSVTEIMDKRTRIVHKIDDSRQDAVTIKNFKTSIILAHTLVIRRNNIDNFDLWDGAPNIIYGTKD